MAHIRYYTTDSGEYLQTGTKELWWQRQGLQYTASGYGKKIPTRHMVHYEGRWRRVYAACFSNACTTFVVHLGVAVNVNAVTV